MRHFLLPGPVTALPFGVRVTTPQAGLIAVTGGTDGLVAHLVGTRRTAVAVATITVAANDDRSAATSAEVASSRKIHWHIWPMGLDGNARFVTYLACNVASWLRARLRF